MALGIGALALGFARATARTSMSVFTMPGWDALKASAQLSGLSAAGLAGLTFLGLFRASPPSNAFATGWLCAYALVRSLAEELVFRAAMLPHPKVDGKDAVAGPWSWAAALPLALFVASHAITTQRAAGVVVRDAKFLFLVTWLGVMCTAVYNQSHGSLWAAVLTHWLIAAPYLCLLGGWRTLHAPPGMGRGFTERPVRAGLGASEPAGAEGTAKTE